MALWVNDRIAGPHAHPHGLFHADHPADDRGRQHLAVLLHAAIRPARADHRRVRLPSHNWLGSQDTALAAVTVVAIWKEAGFFMIFYLAALQCDLAVARRSRGAGRRLALDVLPPRAVSAADADDAVRADQRGDQRLPHGRPHHRDDPRRAGQRHDAAALLHLSGRLQFLGHDLRGSAHHDAARACSRCAAFIQYGVLERRIHYR